VGEHVVTPDMLKVETKKVRVTGRNIVPNVIEPAFGIGMRMD
jgi:glycyl-tRNA synthetase (class II)